MLEYRLRLFPCYAWSVCIPPLPTSQIVTCVTHSASEWLRQYQNLFLHRFPPFMSHVAETMKCVLAIVELTVNHITFVNIHGFQNTHTPEMFTVLGGCIDWWLATNLHCVTFQKSEDLIYAVTDASSHSYVYTPIESQDYTTHTPSTMCDMCSADLWLLHGNRSTSPNNN